jgi:hypothetical protein
MARRNDETTRNKEREDDEIKVTDRRSFTSEGVLKDGVETDPGETPSEPPPEPEPEPVPEPRATEPEPAAEPGSGQPGFERRSLEEPEGVDFTMLINAMAQPALIFLGEIAHPGTGAQEVNLEQARLQIDLLDTLRIKCRGNLTPEEEGLLDRILYQLRMLYVTRSSRPEQ